MKALTDLSEFDGSPKIQHVGESIAYDCTYLEEVTSPIVKIYNLAGTDKSSTMLTGSPIISGIVVTTPLIHDVADGERYKVTVQSSRGGNTLINHFWIIGAA